ncbi:Holliday junction resolvase RuvX [Candidatus Parcubacteria bacterium]|nr:Holliday junction resolvase RuvX [Candidatus Parcubacteria bacterium]
MAIDYGEKRVGIASTDEGGSFALPRTVLPNDEKLLENVLEMVKKESIEEVIMGESKNFAGEDNLIMKKALEFKSELESRGVKVILHPEVLTTMEARRLQGNNDMTDASAAALILKNYLESRV